MRSIVETIDPAGWQFQDSEGNWADTTMPKWYRDQGYEVRPLYTADIFLEAEHRAEQRARAEIGRDSERLDWLENAHASILEDNGGWSVIIGDVEFSCMEETAREAIDAAREVG